MIHLAEMIQLKCFFFYSHNGNQLNRKNNNLFFVFLLDKKMLRTFHTEFSYCLQLNYKFELEGTPGNAIQFITIDQ